MISRVLLCVLNNLIGLSDARFGVQPTKEVRGASVAGCRTGTAESSCVHGLVVVDVVVVLLAL